MEHSNKEKWISEVLDSTTGMTQPRLEFDLFDRISPELNKKPLSMPLPVVRWAAAAAILLFVVNIGTVVYISLHHKKSDKTQQENSLFSELETISTYEY